MTSNLSRLKKYTIQNNPTRIINPKFPKQTATKNPLNEVEAQMMIEQMPATTMM